MLHSASNNATGIPDQLQQEEIQRLKERQEQAAALQVSNRHRPAVTPALQCTNLIYFPLCFWCCFWCSVLLTRAPCFGFVAQYYTVAS